jgi:hypothetical protein
MLKKLVHWISKTNLYNFFLLGLVGLLAFDFLRYIMVVSGKINMSVLPMGIETVRLCNQ